MSSSDKRSFRTSVDKATTLLIKLFQFGCSASIHDKFDVVLAAFSSADDKPEDSEVSIGKSTSEKSIHRGNEGAPQEKGLVQLAPKVLIVHHILCVICHILEHGHGRYCFFNRWINNAGLNFADRGNMKHRRISN